VYWAFERECINRALLDMTAASLRQATEAGRRVYLLPTPETLSDARTNLRAFCEEAATRPQPKGFIPFNSNTQPVGCLGWTELKGSKINRAFSRRRVTDRQYMVDDMMYPAIVYQFVAEEGVPDIDNVVSQTDYFHLLGFMNVPFNGRNWLGKGVLVDFSDIVPHHLAYEWWRPAVYARQQAGWARSVAQSALARGWLGPRPKPIQETPPFLRPHEMTFTDPRHIQPGRFLPAPPSHPHDGSDVSTHAPTVEMDVPTLSPQPVEREEGEDERGRFGPQDREPKRREPKRPRT
jgi:hypothetical protein